MRTRSALIVFAAGLAVSAAPAWALTASAFYREGGQLPGAPVGDLVNSINNPAVNHVRGYAGNLNSSNDGGTTTLSRFWGHPTGGAGSVLRTEGTIGIFTQTSWESFYGIDNLGRAAYSPTVTGGVLSSADSVWYDDTPVAVEGYPHPSLPGKFWRFASRPGVTADGKPYFAGGITSTSGGSTEAYGLFLGIDGSTVLQFSGQVLPNLPRALGSSSVDFDFRMSALGTHYIHQALMVSPTTDDAAMTVDGAGLLVDGTLVQEAHAIPAAAGGQAGENWANFDFMGINEAGDYFFSGDSSLATTADEFIFKNGQMLYRDGMVLDGQTVQGDIEGAYMNEDGDIAFIWDIAGGTLEALYYNNKLLLKEGDLVDLDGDGVTDVNSNLVDFTGISSLALSDRYGPGGGKVDIYFTADIDVNDTSSTLDDIEGFFHLTVPEPGSLGLLGLGAVALLRRPRR